MKFLKNTLVKLLFGLFILGLTSNLYAQDKRATIKTYNKALELANAGKYEQAISMYEQAIEQAEKLGAEGKDIVQRAQQRLPQIQYQIGLQNYKTFQKEKSLESLNATIEGFQEAQSLAKEYGDSQIADKASSVITQLLYSKSLLQYQQKNYEEALATLDQVIKRNPNYAKAYYQKGIVSKNMDQSSIEDALQYFDKAIEVGQKTNDSQIVSNAQEAARDQLIYRGSKEIEAKNYDRAIELLNRALEYDANAADAYYRLAEAYNKMQQWQKAADNAQQALKHETGGKTEQAKIYFELATAYKGLGQKENACSAFGNAAYGSFKSPAEHQMEYELKCESTTN